MNNEFAVISFRKKQKKRSLQTWEIRQCDSTRNHVERKKKIEEQLKILILFRRCLIEKNAWKKPPASTRYTATSRLWLSWTNKTHIGCILLQLLPPFRRILHIGNTAAALCHTEGNSTGSHCCRIWSRIAEDTMALPCHLSQSLAE